MISGPRAFECAPSQTVPLSFYFIMVEKKRVGCVLRGVCMLHGICGGLGIEGPTSLHRTGIAPVEDFPQERRGGMIDCRL